MLLQFLLPDWRAVDVFEIDSLSVPVLVIFRGIEVLICQLAQIAQVVSNREGYVLFGGDVPGVFHWEDVSGMSLVAGLSAHLYRRGCPSAILV